MTTRVPLDDKRLGAILVDAGRLDAGAVQEILRAQTENGLSFEQAGLRLGVIKQDDINFASARQFDVQALVVESGSVGANVVAARQPLNRVVEQLHVLRSQLMFRWFNGQPGHRALAITSAERREGRSFIAANLAVVFAQVGARTVLVDADLRHGCQAKLFKLEDPSVTDGFAIQRAGLSNMLAGQARREYVVLSGVMRNLAVLPAGPASPNPHELLSRPAFGQLLYDLGKEFDVILIDTPAAHYYADTQILASRAGAAVVLARKNLTSAPDLLQLARSLQQSGVEVVGSVLNDV
jgi:protein-tyrosine kinase